MNLREQLQRQQIERQTISQERKDYLTDFIAKLAVFSTSVQFKKGELSSADIIWLNSEGLTLKEGFQETGFKSGYSVINVTWE